MAVHERAGAVPDAPWAEYAIRLDRAHLAHRTFLLGDEGGFVFYEPVAENRTDTNLLPIKWFGASEFGRKYLEANVVWVVQGEKRTRLDCRNQTGFVQYLDHVERSFLVGGHIVRQTFLVPNQWRAFIMKLEAEGDLSFEIEPEFDMRYYQAFNEDFSGYDVAISEEKLHVSNRVESPEAGSLTFYCCIASPDRVCFEAIAPDKRLRRHVYVEDEMREELIQRAYAETHVQVPDEAPLWDTYETTVYAPAIIRGTGAMSLVYAFSDVPDDADKTAQYVISHLSGIEDQKRADVGQRLEQGCFSVDRADVDTVYNQVLIRFNDALVARDVTIHTAGRTVSHWYAIFAGNKYFLDAWKRDENISLAALLDTDDYVTMRAILNETWQFQDERTGRLPHIIRLGEPLVYYSSDGTLWALQRLWQYTHASGDTNLLDAKYDMVEHFFEASLNFVQRGLLPSGGIIDRSYLWETWEDTPYTPRDGYPVEIELLWLTNLRHFIPIIRSRNPALATRLEQTLAEGMKTFDLFTLDGYLADSLTYGWQPRPELTPNPYIAFGLDFPLPPDLARSMVVLARQQLAGACGIRSLALRDWAHVLSPEFVADHQFVTKSGMASVGLYNYHRGIEWLWLNQFFVQGELQYGDNDTAFSLYVKPLVDRALDQGGVGGLGELNDLRGPLGADFQAWSMVSLITSLRAFTGIRVDAEGRHLHIRPARPHSFPTITCRRKIGETRFEVSARPITGGHSVQVRLLDRAPDGYTLHIGARAADPDAVHVRCTGHAVPEDQIQRVSPPAPEVDGEVWVVVPFDRAITVDFVGGAKG